MLRASILTCSLLGLILSAAPARADCLRDCWAERSCDVRNQSQCDADRRACSVRCSGVRSVSHGAIAYGERSHAYGFANDHENAGSAERMAMRNCRKHGDDCRIVASFSNACAALASGAKDRFATAQADTRTKAEAAALAACARDGGGKCDIEVWNCSKP